MTREEATREACRIVSLAYHSIGDYSRASDGFCAECKAHWGAFGDGYHNDGGAIDYVRAAVVDALRRDGYAIADGFDPVTGRELSKDDKETARG